MANQNGKIQHASAKESHQSVTQELYCEWLDRYYSRRAEIDSDYRGRPGYLGIGSWSSEQRAEIERIEREELKTREEELGLTKRMSKSRVKDFRWSTCQAYRAKLEEIQSALDHEMHQQTRKAQGHGN